MKNIQSFENFDKEKTNENLGIPGSKSFEAFMDGTDDIPELPKQAQIEISGEKVGYITKETNQWK